MLITPAGTSEEWSTSPNVTEQRGFADDDNTTQARIPDYEDFISHRYRALVKELGEFEIVESAADASKELVELDEPSIEEH